jgi:hypothetical protein
MAGFGTAGSLLAGAAILFVFASAVVSFRGWPGDVVQSQPVAVVQARAPQASPQVRRVAQVAAAQFHDEPVRPAAVQTAAPASTGTAVIVHTTTSVPSGSLGRAPDARVIAPRIGAVTPSNVSGPPPACTDGGCIVHRVGTTLGGTATAAGSNAGTTVSGAGTTLGSAVTAAGTALGNQVGALNPALGQVVSQAGAAIGSTLTNATGALGATLAGAGKVLGGLLSGEPAASGTAGTQ